MIQLAGLIPAFPLLGFVVAALGQNRLPKAFTGAFASLMVFLSFLCSAIIFFNGPAEAFRVDVFSWIHSGNLNIPFAFWIDHLTIVMLLIVTGIGFLIHVYSIGYMHDDERFSTFFSYLNLFIFFMLLLVMGDNYIVLFTGWEGVGLCSYLLIGFWFRNNEYNKAANKAFIMNRIGDLGFLLGILLTFVHFGTLQFSELRQATISLPDNEPVIIAISLLLFIGAIGKSAQIPLYTWLPDAMAGPTPVSALIHAATMVTAGIYMVVRSNFLYSIAPETLSVIALIGMATALFSATIAIVQTDIKKVLAYSTVSQLGFMFVALGTGAYATAMFHVTTHAFFKALLFLAAGSVIHAMGGEQDIRKMGGLKKKLRVTFIVFAIGTFAISGLPPFSGFFSKDEILANAWMQNKALFVFLVITSILTAIYMFRLFYLTFYGSFRGTAEQEKHLHESPPVMTLPLIILAILSAFGGFIGMPRLFSEAHLFGNYLNPMLVFPGSMSLAEPDHSFEYSLLIFSLIFLAGIIFFTYRYYIRSKRVPSLDEKEFTPSVRVLYNKYYIDEIYRAIIVDPIHKFGAFCWNIIDNKIIDGLVNGVNKVLLLASGSLRYVQSGNIGFYIFAMVFGILAILALNLWR